MKFITLGDSKYFKRFGGGTPKKSVKEYWENGSILWLSNSELEDDKINYVNNCFHKISDIGLKKSSASLIPRNSVLLTCTASIGKVGINTVELATNQQFNSFECSRDILPKYLAYYFLTIKDKLKSLAGKTSFLHITTSSLNKIKIPLPPLSTQKQIVSILERAEKLKEKRKITNEDTNKIIQSVFYEMFGDPVKNEKFPIKKFGDVCLFIRGPFGGSLKKEIFQTEGYAIYEQQHAIGDDFSNIRYFVNEDKFNEMKRFELKSGDLIMSCSGTMGKIAIVPKAIKKGIINQALLKLTPNENISAVFLKFWLESKTFQDSLRIFSQGAAIQNVASVKILKEIKLSLPPIELQNQFADIVQKIESLKEKQKESTNNINILFNALMQKAFKGEIKQ